MPRCRAAILWDWAPAFAGEQRAKLGPLSYTAELCQLRRMFELRLSGMSSARAIMLRGHATNIHDTREKCEAKRRNLAWRISTQALVARYAHAKENKLERE